MKILMLGDSPFINTGFGTVNREAVRALSDHELIILGGQDATDRGTVDNITFVPMDDLRFDIVGYSKVYSVIEQHKPDAIHIIADPGTVGGWFAIDEIRTLPTVVYMPVEGEPFNILWKRIFDVHPSAKFITCTNFGARVLSQNGIEAQMAYHGVSPDFIQYSDEKRNAKRIENGWDSSFVVICVAQNVRRKQWPRLFEAMALARKRVPNLKLYAHTVPYNNNWLDGHDLPQLAHHLGISDMVMFDPRRMDRHNASVPLKESYDGPSLVDFYNMADAFILPSEIEGFGIPLAEAMAVGLPVATTDIGPQAEVVGSSGILIPVHDYEWNKSMAKVGHSHPRDIADAIVKMSNPENNKRLRKRAKERSSAFNWGDYHRILREVFHGEAWIPIQEQGTVQEAAEKVAKDA